MKYIYSIITFIVGFILFVFFHVAMDLEIGGYFSFLFIAIVFAVTGYVYKKSDVGRRTVSNETGPPLSKHEIKDFSKVFTSELFAELSIKSVYIKCEHNDDFDYTVYID